MALFLHIICQESAELRYASNEVQKPEGKIMLRENDFKKPPYYFHFNFEYGVFGYFKELDWLLIQRTILHSSQLYRVQIQALVMMDTHVHLLFRIPDQREHFFTQEIIKKLKASEENIQENQVEPITNLSQYLNTYKYIYRNPVEAGIVNNCEDYAHSSLHGLLGRSSLRLQINDSMGLIQNPVYVLNWLNNKDQMFKYSQAKSISPMG